MTISAGLATLPDVAASDLELLEAADTALYQAKKNGRNRLEIAQKESD